MKWIAQLNAALFGGLAHFHSASRHVRNEGICGSAQSHRFEWQHEPSPSEMVDFAAFFRRWAD
jgi:hypothetical protein